MGIFNKNPLIEAIWELTKKRYPEWDAPITPKEGLSEEEKEEDVNYFDDNEDCLSFYAKNKGFMCF